MSLKFEVDSEKIAKDFGKLGDQIKKDIKEAVGSLASMTHARAHELARDELGSLSQTYSENLGFQQLDENLWVVSLDEKAMWIEEGRKSGFMRELLDGKSGKVSKDGKKYAVIPFKHNQPPSRQSMTAQNLANQIKDAMEKKGLSWGKIETDSQGSPRIGKLHSFNVESAKLKDSHKTPATYGVSVYQHKTPDGATRRDVMTFRVITEDHEKEGKWNHPGRKADKLLDKSLAWAENVWETQILPAILAKYDK